MTTLTTKISILTIILALTLGAETIDKKDPVKIDTKELSLINALDLEFVEEAPIIEDWMLEELDTSEEAPIIEDWMLEELYTTEEAPIIEDWMLEELVSPEEEPMLEDWMFDIQHYSY